jgi:hypothetical protein
MARVEVYRLVEVLIQSEEQRSKLVETGNSLSIKRVEV